MYIQNGYLDTGYFLEVTPYFEIGYIEDGYVEGYSYEYPTVAISFSFSYLFFAARVLESVPLAYLFDNQISLEPLRIVRAKNNP